MAQEELIDDPDDLAASPGFPEELKSLHPALLEALNHPMARAESEAAVTSEERPPERNLDLLVGDLNFFVSHIVTGLEDPNAYFNERVGMDIMTRLTRYGNENGRTTALKLLLVALGTFAKTKLWPALEPSKEFTPENYARCAKIMQIIRDIFSGPITGGNVGGGGN